MKKGMIATNVQGQGPSVSEVFLVPLSTLSLLTKPSMKVKITERVIYLLNVWNVAVAVALLSDASIPVPSVFDCQRAQPLQPVAHIIINTLRLVYQKKRSPSIRPFNTTWYDVDPVDFAQL